MKPAAFVLVLVASVGSAPAPAAAEPLPVRFAEQAPPPGPAGVRVQADTAIVTGVGGDVRNSSLVIDLHGRRGGWTYGIELGWLGWWDRYAVISEHRTRGLQPTNPVLTAVYWRAPGRSADGPFRLGLHLAVMPGITGGVDCDCDGSYDNRKMPSQIARFTAVPYTVPDETAFEAGLLARYDDGRFMAQAEAAIVGIVGKRSAPADTPNHGWFAAGVGVRVRHDLALTAHGFAHRGKQIYQPYEHRYAAGLGAHLEVAGATVSARFDQRLDACYAGDWLPSDPDGTCTRIVVDYARRF